MLTEAAIASRYFADARRMARARAAGRGWMADEMESAAMAGLAEAARCAARDGLTLDEAGAYVRRTVRLRLLDCARSNALLTRRGNPRLSATLATGGEGVTHQVTPPQPDAAPRQADASAMRLPLGREAQAAMSRGVGHSRTAHVMRWLVLALALSSPAWADATVTWPRADVGGLPIPTSRTPLPGETRCHDNSLRKCWSAEIIAGQAGNLVVDDDPQPGETHRWTPCFRAGLGYVLAVCWNDCGQGLEARVPTNCVGPSQPVAPAVVWP